jgi:hypothetical protein
MKKQFREEDEPALDDMNARDAFGILSDRYRRTVG